MHDLLFDNATALEAHKLPGYAAALGLDVTGFEECLASERHLNDIDADISEARRAGIRGTPSFVVGVSKNDIVTGARIVGAQPLSAFEQQIQAQLKAAGGSDQ